ncbi:MAG: RNA polymerase sigma factor [Steroidobacteraceae bacterium]
MTPLGSLHIDGATVERARLGDPAAQRQIYDRLGGVVFALLRRMLRDESAAEDMFQNTMMKVFSQLGSFRGAAPLGIWVRQIALREALQYLRSPWRRLAWLGNEAQARLELIAEPAPAETADYLDAEKALARLSPMARAVLWLHEVEGMGHAEIGSSFGRSASFSKSQLARARAALQKAAPGASKPAAAVTVSKGAPT